jgi:3',5'-cyclic AMP phosphodiesterase CpdA
MRIAHLSDLHFGHHDQSVVESLAADIAGQRPALVVVSGDFTQRGLPEEFAAARAFLDTLPAPVFAVPGNHDIPARNLWRRFVNPYGLYRRHIGDDLEPFVEMDGVAIAGLKTSRRARARLNWAEGSISRDQLDRLARVFADATEGAVRVVVAHHPLMAPAEPAEVSMRLVGRAAAALRTFAALGVRVVLSGHFHLSYVRKYAPGERAGVPPGPRLAAVAPILVVQASSTVSTRLRGHPNGYNLIDIEGQDISVAVRDWHDGRWETRAETSVDRQDHRASAATPATADPPCRPSARPVRP